MRHDKVVLLDFCGTIVPFQTANLFVDYVAKKKPTKHSKRTKKWMSFLNEIRLIGAMRRLFPTWYIDKRFILYMLKGKTETELRTEAKNYYEDLIKPNFIKEVLDEILKLKDEGFLLCILSGGYDIYLEEFAKEFGIKHIISSCIEFKDSLATGRMVGKDCMNKNKIRLLRNHFPDDSDLSGWYFFSDSITDLPVLQLVGHPVVISNGESQKWARSRSIKEIIYNQNNNENGYSKIN